MIDTKDAVLAPSDEAIGALATAMWDAVHTVRLSEHPEETEPMIERAKATARWLGRFGWSVVRSDAIAQAEQAATERAVVDGGRAIRSAFMAGYQASFGTNKHHIERALDNYLDGLRARNTEEDR